VGRKRTDWAGDRVEIALRPIGAKRRKKNTITTRKNWISGRRKTGASWLMKYRMDPSIKPDAAQQRYGGYKAPMEKNVSHKAKKLARMKLRAMRTKAKNIQIR